MTTEQKTDDPLAETAVQVYIYVCLTALVVLFLVLVRRGMGSGSFIPAVIGILGLGLRWRLAACQLLVRHPQLEHLGDTRRSLRRLQ